MIDLPEPLRLRHLRENLKRGSVFWFRTRLLDDPAVAEKEKYAVVLSCEIENDEVLFGYTTTRIDPYRVEPFKSVTLVFPVGRYSFFDKETALPARNIKALPLQALARLPYPSQFDIKGSLIEEDLRAVDRIVMASRFIELAVKLRCLPKRQPPSAPR